MGLEDLRKAIDSVDDELVSLFEKRLSLAKEVARIKKAENIPIVNTSREREIINRLTETQDDTVAGFTKILYTTIFDLSRTYQSKLIADNSKIAENIKNALENTPQLFPKSAVIACQGTEGANSTAACEKIFVRPSIMYFNTFDGVFGAVDKGLCSYGILPIENSLHGSVTTIYDLMKKYSFYIVKSLRLKINHTLLAKHDVKLSDIKTIYSHEQALGQCSEFLKSLNVKIIPCENTAIAAKMVAESDSNDIAAISSIGCAELYSLNILCENVQNSDNNYTKFICISKKLEIYPGAKRVSLMMTLPHRPGELYRLMAKFSALGINLTKLESRPMPDKDFEFMFYFDLDVSVYDQAVFDLFSQLESSSQKFVFMGCYTEE